MMQESPPPPEHLPKMPLTVATLSHVVLGATLQAEVQDGADPEIFRAMSLYEPFQAGMQSLLASGELPGVQSDRPLMQTDVQIFSEGSEHHEQGRLGAYHDDVVHLERGFSEATFFHEVTHRNIGEFDVVRGQNFPLLNEALTQIVTRGITTGKLEAGVSNKDSEVYDMGEHCIAMLCGDSNGEVTLQDFLKVYTAQPDEKLQELAVLASKVKHAYGKDVLLDACELWYNATLRLREISQDPQMANIAADILVEQYIANETSKFSQEVKR